MVVAYFEVKVLWMYQAMDHEEIIGAIDQGANYRSGSKLWVNRSVNNKWLDGGWISEQLKDFIFITFRH